MKPKIQEVTPISMTTFVIYLQKQSIRWTRNPSFCPHCDSFTSFETVQDEKKKKKIIQHVKEKGILLPLFYGLKRDLEHGRLDENTAILLMNFTQLKTGKSDFFQSMEIVIYFRDRNLLIQKQFSIVGGKSVKMI